MARMTAPDDPVELAAERSATAFDAGSTTAFGPHDVAAARVHADEVAAEGAHQRGASAYTIGTDIYFGDGAYAPDIAAGRHLIAHELAHVAQARRGAVPGGLVMRQIADRLEYDNLAERIHTAIAGLGTDEEAVYLALQQLDRDPTAIGRLEARYLARYGVSLQADIEDDFSGTELEYALQLLGRGTLGSAQAIGAPPASSADIQAAARRLRAAMDIIGTDEEAIYAVLRPFGRDLRLLEDLRLAYAALYSGEDLRSRIVDEMSGSELDYALYLLGGAPIRAQPEITEMSPAQAATVFTQLAAMTFWTATYERSPIPFHFPIDGCYARAQLMADRLTELGFASEKVFAIAQTPAGRSDLHVLTPYARDVAAPTQPTVDWWYHVAPIVRVRDALGVVRETVLDPSMGVSPLELNQWLGRMSGVAFSRKSPEEARAEAVLTHGDFAPGDHFVFTFDRNAFYPGDVAGAPTAQDAQTRLEQARPTMTGYAKLAQVHEIAAAIRGAMTGMVVDVPAIIAAIRAAPREARQALFPRFPHLGTELQARVAPADMASIIAEVNAP
jgi:glutaminase-like protein/uncharacterized protein DUF4157